MNTKICKACGQTNFPEAAVCSNCHLNLGKELNNPGVQTQAMEKKSNKLYWILGGVAGLVVVGGFFIVAIAGGIYYYTSSPTVISETNTNTVENTKTLADKNVDDKKSKDEKDLVESGGDNLKAMLEKKHSRLGKFRQQSVAKIEERNKMIFKESADEAFALYSTSDKNPLEILFSIANFSSVSDAKKDVATIKDKILSEKNGKIIKESKLSDGVIISYRKNKLIGILDCKDKTCTQITGIDGKKVSDFYKQVTDNVF